MKTIRIEPGADGIVVLVIDGPSTPINILTAEFEADLGEAISLLAADPEVKGVVITSGKQNGFMAGADLGELSSAYGRVTLQQAYERSARLSTLFRRLETCGKPVAAALNGFALGAGLELALACHYRVLSDHPRAVIGFPEVNVGLLPAGGGTQRLPRLIGIPSALPLLLTGQSLGPAAALESGIVHEVLPATELVAGARRWILNNPASRQPWDRKGFLVPGGVGCLAGHSIESFQIGTSRIVRATQHNYPAPIAILSSVFEGTQVPLETALRIESKYFAKLLTSPVARNLMRTMSLNKGEADKLARRPKSVPKGTVEKLGVLGAGLMGAGIAYVAAVAGIEVVLLDATDTQAGRGKEHSARLLAKQLESGRADQGPVTAVIDRITATADYSLLAGCDLVIEAVFENDDIKRQVIQGAAAATSRDTILASNTSTLSITGLARACPRPEQFIGIHFFSPVERMALVEIIRGKRTSDAALALALDFAAQLRKTPIVVNDSPGFFTSRVFGTFVDEGMAMLAQGVEPAAIENAARMAGMPIGPLAVCDEVSIELQLRVHEAAVTNRLAKRFQRLTAISVVKRMIELGRGGRRAGAGFYDYPAGDKKHLWPGLRGVFPVSPKQPEIEHLRSRFLLIQALEAARCVEEGVIEHPADADLGSVLGIGYPAWTGGVLSYIETLGLRSFLEACDRLAKDCGARFRPSAAFRERVAACQPFYEPIAAAPAGNL